MDDFIEVEFEDGLVRHWEFPETVEGRAVMVEVDVDFNDISQGLRGVVRHHTVPANIVENDMCGVVKDYKIEFVPMEDIGKVMVCRYGGKERLVRFKNGLVNLSKLQWMSNLYCDTDAGYSLLNQVYTTACALRAANACATDEEIAYMLGVPIGMIDEAEAAFKLDDDSGLDNATARDVADAMRKSEERQLAGASLGNEGESSSSDAGYEPTDEDSGEYENNDETAPADGFSGLDEDEYL